MNTTITRDARPVQRPVQVNPENAEAWLTRARLHLARLGETERAEAILHGSRILAGLFTLVADEIPLSDAEQTELAAFEWLLADGEVSAYLLGRVKRGILNVAVARLVSGLAARWRVPGARHWAAA